MVRSGAMRVLAGFLFLVLLATFVPPGTRGEPERLPAVATIRFAPVPLDDSDPARTRDGALRFLGEWHLTSDDRRFGGISAMHVGEDGVTAFSDAGWLIRFPLPRDGLVSHGFVGALPEGP